MSTVPALPPLAHEAMDKEAMSEAFVQNLTLLGAEPHAVRDLGEGLTLLAGILAEAGIRRLCVNEDPLFDDTDLIAWADAQGLALVRARDFDTRRAYTEAVFDENAAGLTTVDHAVAESGTLVIAHDHRHSRLISLAPAIHIALVRTGQVVPVYEGLLDGRGPGSPRTSQVTLITGPSMTADIQATPFKGMHGPKRLIVLLIDTEDSRP
jgi:L-lactate dehydrogenase complex protein LldG